MESSVDHDPAPRELRLFGFDQLWRVEHLFDEPERPEPVDAERLAVEYVRKDVEIVHRFGRHEIGRERKTVTLVRSIPGKRKPDPMWSLGPVFYVLNHALLWAAERDWNVYRTPGHAYLASHPGTGEVLFLDESRSGRWACFWNRCESLR